MGLPDRAGNGDARKLLWKTAGSVHVTKFSLKGGVGLLLGEERLSRGDSRP